LWGVLVFVRDFVRGACRKLSSEKSVQTGSIGNKSDRR
jgi:hypothetical protein